MHCSQCGVVVRPGDGWLDLCQECWEEECAEGWAKESPLLAAIDAAIAANSAPACVRIEIGGKRRPARNNRRARLVLR